jgi:acyl-coenzyme A synthetase/AMP-(fatty) acid ligase
MLEHKVTIFKAVASAYLDIVERNQRYAGELRVVDIGGEPIDLMYLQAFRTLFSDRCRLLLRFSTSETRSIFYRLITQAMDLPKSISYDIFVPIHKRVFVVDDDANELPLGSKGKLAVQGPCVALEYWKNRQTTDESIVDEGDRSRTFYTMDRVQLDEGTNGPVMTFLEKTNKRPNLESKHQQAQRRARE